MKPLFPLLAVLLAFTPGCGDEDREAESGGGEATRYAAELGPLNDSRVTAHALLELEEDAIRVRISARGLREDQIILPLDRREGLQRQARSTVCCPALAGADVAVGATRRRIGPRAPQA